MKSCLDYFKEICAIPHGSGHEKALSDYVCQYAKQLNLEYFQDEHYNVIIKKLIKCFCFTTVAKLT